MRRLLMRGFSALNTWLYRASGGRMLGRLPSGAPICLLTTRGRKSGRHRTVPLLYLADGADLVVVASQGGAPKHPGWFHNLTADPAGEVQIGSHRFAVTARPVSAEEKSALWPRLLALYPAYEAYQRRTARAIPLVRLRPA